MVLLSSYYISRLLFPVVGHFLQTLYQNTEDTKPNEPVQTICIEPQKLPFTLYANVLTSKPKKHKHVSSINLIPCPEKAEKIPDSSSNSADSISVLGLIMASVTLMLSLGSTWLVTRQREIGLELQKLESLRVREEMRLSLINYRLLAESELAKYSHQTWGTHASFIKLRPELELLASDNPVHRRNAKLKLSSHIGVGLRPQLPATFEYCIEIKHYLIFNRLAKSNETYCELFS